MPKIVILGSCKYKPYVMLLAPNPFDEELYAKDHDKAYVQACEKFYPAIDKADFIIVYCPDGIGKHTQKDIKYAKKMKKKIVYVV